MSVNKENEQLLYPENTAFAKDLNKEYNDKLLEFELNPDIESLIDLELLEKDPYRARLLYYLYGDPYWKPVEKENLRIDDKGQVWDYRFKDKPKLLREVRSEYLLPGVTVTNPRNYWPDERRLARYFIDNALNYEQLPKYLEGSSGTPMTMGDLMEGVNVFSAGASNWIFPMFHFPGLIRKGIEHPGDVSAYDVFLGHYPIMGEKFELQHPFLNLGAEMAIGGGLEGLARNSSKLLPGVEKVVKSIGSHTPTIKALLNAPIKPIISPGVQWTPQMQKTFDEMIKRMSLSTKVSLDILKEIADRYGISLSEDLLNSSPNELIRRYNISIVPENTKILGRTMNKALPGATLSNTIEGGNKIDPIIYLTDDYLRHPEPVYTGGVHEGNHAFWWLPEVLEFFKGAVEHIPPHKFISKYDKLPYLYTSIYGYPYPEISTKELLNQAYPTRILHTPIKDATNITEKSAVNALLRTKLLTASPKIDLNNPSTWKKWREIIKNLKREDILKFDGSSLDLGFGGAYHITPSNDYMRVYLDAINKHIQSAGNQIVNLYADNMKQAFRYVPGIAALIGGIGVTLHKRGGSVKWHGKKFKWRPIPKGEQGLTFGMENLFGNDMPASNSPVTNNNGATDELLITGYLKNVIWEMENPKRKGYLGNGWWEAYEDSASPENYGPGINFTSGIIENYKKGVKKYHESSWEKGLRNKLKNCLGIIYDDFDKMGINRKKLSNDKMMILLDLMYNCKPGTGNPQKWQNLVQAMVKNDELKIYNELHTKDNNERRRKMRMLLLGLYNPLTIKIHNV